MKAVFALGTAMTLPLAIWAQQVEAGGRLYLLAASPTIYGPVTYPADLYTIDENNKLQQVRNVAPAEDGVDFVLASPNALVVAHPHINPTALDIVHFDDPGAPDTVRPSIGGRNIMDGFIVEFSGQTIVALDLVSSVEQTPPQMSLVGINVERSGSGQRVIDPLPWTRNDVAGSHGGARIEGDAGGALIGRSPHLAATLTKDAQPPGWQERTAAVLCANGRFTVFAGVSRSHEEALAQTTSTVIVYDRQAGTSRAVTVPGSQSRYRIFGSWLAVLVVHSAELNKAPMPGSTLQRKRASATLPGVAENYEDARRTQGEWLPGTLELINLETGGVIQQKTNQADSEILSVSDKQVLYRVNQQILSAPIIDDQLGESVLLVEDANVPEIHWVFLSKSK